MVSKTLALFTGLFLAATAQFLAIGLSGAGHGWVAPFGFSLILWFAYPALGSLLSTVKTPKSRALGTLLPFLLVLAVCADFALLAVGDHSNLDRVAGSEPEWVVAWMAFWLGWQIAAIVLAGKRAWPRR